MFSPMLEPLINVPHCNNIIIVALYKLNFMFWKKHPIFTSEGKNIYFKSKLLNFDYGAAQL